MLSYFGSEINGLVSSVTQFVGYFALVEAGLSAAMVCSLYKPLAENDKDGISAIVSAAKRFYYKSGYIFLALVGLLAMTYPFFVDYPAGMGYGDILLLVFISGVSGAIDMFTLAKYTALLNADQKTYVISLASTAYVILNTVLIALFAALGLDIAFVKGIALLAVLSRTVILVAYCRKQYPYINNKAKPNYSALDKRWDALFQQILGVVQNGAPVVILTVVTGDLKLVSIYAVYNMVIAGLGALLGIFNSGLAASFGEVIAKGEKKTLQKAYSDFETAYYLVISVIYAVAFVMILPFIKIYTAGITDAVYTDSLVGFLFVLNGLLYNIKTPQGMLVLSAGLYKETRYRSLAQALIIIVVGVPLAYFYGLVGVLLGLLASNIYRAVDLLFFIPKYVTGLSFWHTLKKWAVIAVNTALTFGAFSLIQFPADSYLAWVLLAVCVAGICGVINLITFSIVCPGDMKSLLGRVRKLIKK
jgi:O-antigen/teichoic acid export membrane protein